MDVDLNRSLCIAVLALVLLATACSSGGKPVSEFTTATGIVPSPTTVAPTRASVSPKSLPSTLQLSAPSANVVWALVDGAKLFRSEDSGDSWSQRSLPNMGGPVAGSEISFVDDQQGWLLAAASPATQCTFEATSIWHTSDGGATWQELPSTSSGAVRTVPGIAAAQCKGGLAFIDQSHGFLSASDPNSPPVIYTTSDGGNTWTASAPLPDPPGEKTSAGGFTLSPRNVQRAGGILLLGADGWGHAYVYESTDGGATWAWAAIVPNSTDAGQVAFRDATHWWATDTASAGQVTADSGATWTAAPARREFSSPDTVTAVFANPETGYATADGVIRRTNDGGTHWTDVQTPGVAPG